MCDVCCLLYGGVCCVVCCVFVCLFVGWLFVVCWLLFDVCCVCCCVLCLIVGWRLSFVDCYSLFVVCRVLFVDVCRCYRGLPVACCG